jgi:hypothetical protein
MTGSTESAESALGRFGRDLAEDNGDIVEVRLLGFPLPLWARAREHHDELMREFALLALSREPVRHDVPRRLQKLIDVLGRQYGAAVEASNAERDRAWRRGETTCDLVYRVPRSIRHACVQLSALLDEADRFCRAGRELLTLAAPPDVLAFRRWYLDEFVRQIDGREPTPWPGVRSRDGRDGDGT